MNSRHGGDASKADAIREALTETQALGALVNRVTHCDTAPPWTFGIAALMRNLAGRGLLRVGYRQRIYEEEWPFALAARTQAAIK